MVKILTCLFQNHSLCIYVDYELEFVITVITVGK